MTRRSTRPRRPLEQRQRACRSVRHILLRTRRTRHRRCSSGHNTRSWAAAVETAPLQKLT
eukprot:4405485-Prymnesium_polylepis.1